MLISGIIFIGSVLLMNPKGGLGFGISGIGGINEYGSKKSIETTLKKAAIISSVIFLLAVLFYPYV
jgi:protein translocase SecG subunit